MEANKVNGSMSYDGWTDALLQALRESPLSAREVAAALGQSVSDGNVAAIWHALELLQRQDLVRRQRIGRGPWRWEIGAARP